jgi:hypothetical protein
MIFYLGTHHPNWLGEVSFPLFVSRRRLQDRKTFPRALGPWAHDSGGFTELAMNGDWSISMREYVALVRRFHSEIGNMAWSAPMDWMCEPFMLAKTRGTVESHQRRTVINYVALMECAPDLPWIPVLQGWTHGDYLNCIDLYHRYRVPLESLPLVGIGSVFRRQGETRIALLIEDIARQGIKLHAFGMKTKGIELCGHVLESSDSMSWSYTARRQGNFCGSLTHKNCANCLIYATEWRDRIVRLAGQAVCDVPPTILPANTEAGILP